MSRLEPAATKSASAGLARVAAGFPILALILQDDEPGFLDRLLEILKNSLSVLQWILETKVLGIPKSPLELIAKLFPGDLAGDINSAWAKIFTPPTLEGSFWGIFLLVAMVVGFVLIHITFGVWLFRVLMAVRKEPLRKILKGEVKDLPSPLVYPIFNYAIPLLIVMLGFILMQLGFNVVYFVVGQYIDLTYEGTSFGVAAFDVVVNVLTGWGFFEFTTTAPALLISFWVFMFFLVIRWIWIPLKGTRMILWVGRYSHREFAAEVVKQEGWNVASAFITFFVQIAVFVTIPVAVSTPPFSLWGGTTKVIPGMFALGVVGPWILFGLTLIPVGVWKWLRPKDEYSRPGTEWEAAKTYGKYGAEAAKLALIAGVPEAGIALELYQAMKSQKSGQASQAIGKMRSLRARPMQPVADQESAKPRVSPKVSGEGRSLAQDYIDQARNLGTDARKAADEIFGFAAVLRAEDPSSFDDLAATAYDRLSKMSGAARKKWAKVGRDMKDTLEEEHHETGES